MICSPPPITLRVWEGDYGVPSTDPCSLIALTVFKMFGIKKTVIQTAYFPFFSNIPSISRGKFFTDDKEKLLKYVFNLSQEVTLLSLKQQKMIEEYITYFLENFAKPFYVDCWIHETNYRHAIENWFTNVIPFPFNTIYLNHNRKEAQKVVALYMSKWDYDRYITKKYEDAAICLGDFNYLLKDGRKFMYQNIPTYLDAVLYSYLVIAMRIPLHNPTLQNLIYRHTWLLNYINRMTEDYFPNTPIEFKYVDPIYGSFVRMRTKSLVVSGICVASIMLLYAYITNAIKFGNLKICFSKM
ncbi:hypothetical protein FQR65_LT13085 [Abscondita terminalis]|nr:hypothetical protein FQR65_LT13085 [Abscondita terminalis]